MEGAAEIAPQGKRKKQTTEEDIAIETLDRKRKELREIQDKATLQKIEYTELVKTVRKKRRQQNLITAQFEQWKEKYLRVRAFFIRLLGSATFTATLKLASRVGLYRNFWNTERWKSFN